MVAGTDPVCSRNACGRRGMASSVGWQTLRTGVELTSSQSGARLSAEDLFLRLAPGEFIEEFVEAADLSHHCLLNLPYTDAAYNAGTRLVLPTMTSVATMAAALRLPHFSHAFKPALSVASHSDLECARKARLPASWCRQRRSGAWACFGRGGGASKWSGTISASDRGDRPVTPLRCNRLPGQADLGS